LKGAVAHRWLKSFRVNPPFATPWTWSLLSESGIQCLRIDIPSPDKSQQDSPWQEMLDALIPDRESINSKWIGVIGTGSNQTMGIPNWNLDYWRTTIQKILRQYPWVRIWEIGNESYNPIYSSGYLGSEPNPTNYFQMLKIAYQEIKTYNQNDIVLGLSGPQLFTTWQGNNPPTTSNEVKQCLSWSAKIWNLGAEDYCDGISLHAYSGGKFLLEEHPYILSESSPTPQQSKQSVQEYWDNLMGMYYDLVGSKPIWITETGFPTKPRTAPNVDYASFDDRQLTFAKESLSYFRSKKNIDAVIWYIALDMPPYSSTGDSGLWDSLTGEPRPALSMFK
jgi:hypothetical protein